jgi:hypothetical protein
MPKRAADKMKTGADGASAKRPRGKTALSNDADSLSDHVNPPFTMTEYACPQRALFVANLSLDEFMPIAASSKSCKNDVKGSYRRVVEWASKHAESDLNTGVVFTYRFAEDKNFGRLTSKSMTAIPREIRGFVCVDETTRCPIMTDLDMDNAHPTILFWLCEKHGIRCDSLAQYVLDRKRHMQDLMDSTGKSKERVKEMFLAAVNSQDNMSWQSNVTVFFKELDKECKAIQQAFLQLKEYSHILPHAQKAAQAKLEVKKAELQRNRKTVNGLVANVAGSFINLVLCTWENRFLGAACEAVDAMNLQVCCNAFDGMLIKGDHYPKGEEPTVKDDEICPALEKVLHDKYGIKMAWSMKRHCSSIEFHDDALKLPYSKFATPFLEKVCRVGSEYMIEMTDGSFVTETGKQLVERFKSKTAQCLLEKDHPTRKAWYARTFGETLMLDPAMREYEMARMYPNNELCPPYVFNTWKPMPCESWDVAQADVLSENVAAFRELVLILSDRDEKVAAFVELWIAHMVHFPDRKPGAWIVFMSEEGGGKGTLVKMITKVIGELKVQEINNVQRSLLGGFNEAMYNAFLVVLDEAAGKHLFDGKEELKNMIAAPRITVNRKYRAAEMIDSYARFMVTIQPRPVPTKKGDRRGLIVRCSDELIGNTAYWEKTNRMVDECPSFGPDVHAYLMSLKPPPVFQITDIPQTEVQFELQEGNADVFDSWVAHVVEEWLVSDGDVSGAKLSDYKGKRGLPQLLPEFTMKELWVDFGLFARRTNSERLIEGVTFQRFCSKFAICRWRKAFDYKPLIVKGKAMYPRHLIDGDRLQCRRWDMMAIARDLGLASSSLVGAVDSLHGGFRDGQTVLASFESADELRTRLGAMKQECEQMQILGRKYDAGRHDEVKQTLENLRGKKLDEDMLKTELDEMPLKILNLQSQIKTLESTAEAAEMHVGPVK